MYRLALPLVLVALVPSLIGLNRDRAQIVQSKRTIEHLCKIDHALEVVFTSAVLGYESLGEQATPSQKRLILVLSTAVRDIRNDTSCPR
jgi:hypothetical protein